MFLLVIKVHSRQLPLFSMHYTCIHLLSAVQWTFAELFLITPKATHREFDSAKTCSEYSVYLHIIFYCVNQFTLAFTTICQKGKIKNCMPIHICMYCKKGKGYGQDFSVICGTLIFSFLENLLNVTISTKTTHSQQNKNSQDGPKQPNDHCSVDTGFMLQGISMVYNLSPSAMS